MRRIECGIRREKDTAAAAQAAGDDQLRVDCQLRINHLSDLYKKVTDASGLTPRRERMTVEGFRKAKIPKADDKNALTKGSKSGNINSEETVFTPAKTIEEATEYAKKVLGIPNASYAGADIRVANEWNRGLADSFRRFPELRDRFGFTGVRSERNKLVFDGFYEKFLDEEKKNALPGFDPRVLELTAERKAQQIVSKYFCHPTAYAESYFNADKYLSKASGISINDKWAVNSSSLEASMSGTVLSKFHPEGTGSIRGILDHEIGHQLDSLLGLRQDKEIKDIIDKMSDKELTENLSKYSWDNAANHERGEKYNEAIAEAWAEYCNNPKCRPTAMAIGKRIEELYKKKYGR